jgi:hypothetical protein
MSMATATDMSRAGRYLSLYTDAATLAFFRLAFGFMMLFTIVRFTAHGWIDAFYIRPVLHFTYYGFSWVKPPGLFTYGLFAIAAVSALFVAIGYRYRLSATLFFLSFTYAELMDKTTYLNHYYFVTVVSFVMIFLPAGRFFAVDAWRHPENAASAVPRWTTDILKLLLGIVYFYAGIAKLNSDWLFHAMPLRIWLSGNSGLPVVGAFLVKPWVAFAFSWAGAAYDLAIPFLLLYAPTRKTAFVLVVVFHILTRILFPIGVFPYIMIVATLVFFNPSFHRNVLHTIARLLRLPPSILPPPEISRPATSSSYKFKVALLAAFVAVQLLFPFRYLLYPGELFWTEEGFRFSWRVMLMEKAGYVQFIVSDPNSGKTIYVDNRMYLTAFQEKQMAFQPDFILEYAHFLHDHYEREGMADPEVHVQSYVALNGRLSRLYIDPKVDLAHETESFRHKDWILPFHDTIEGL